MYPQEDSTSTPTALPMPKHSFAKHDCPHCHGMGTVIAMDEHGDSEEYDCECISPADGLDAPHIKLDIVMTFGGFAALEHGEDDWSGAVEDSFDDEVFEYTVEDIPF